MLDRRQTVLAAAAALAGGPQARGDPPSGMGKHEPTGTIDLWPMGAIDVPAGLAERIEDRSKAGGIPDRAVHGIVRPRLEVFRPDRPNGSAVLVAPGGGYRRVVVDKEGHETARWFAARGFTAFVLFYRLPGEGWAAGPNVGLADAQRAIRLIRARASDYRISPERVAALGFSAGGHVCGELSTRHAFPAYAPIDAADRLTARPDVAALIYAVQSMTAPMAHVGSRDALLGDHASADLERLHSPARNVTRDTPPCFLVHAEDDPVVPIDNSLAMRAALKAQAIAVETHLFQNGGHGFGLRGTAGKPAEAWPDLFAKWAGTWGLG